ncbi:MAG: AraC family transcriptional regulator [Victivallales bacterium]|jgi:AraC-like DNA-binding protein|nr:AraC family transcriptional regulator [Victivallales bacterium]
MKILNDLSSFQWNPLPASIGTNNVEIFHVRSRRSYRMLLLQPGTLDYLLWISCICEVHLLDKAHYMRRLAPFLSIEYVKHGSLLVRQRGRAWELEPGEIFIMQPHIESEFASGKGGCEKISVLVTGSLLESFLQKTGLAEMDVVPRLDVLHIEKLLREITELAEETPSNTALPRNSLLTFELLQSLRIPPGVSEMPDKIVELRDKLEEHPEHDWSQQEMANLCNCSCNHLVRLFKKHLGTTPRQYLLELRMHRAKHLLADKQLSIKEISARIGYENAFNFSAEFHKRFGTSPSEYRKQLSLFA